MRRFLGVMGLLCLFLGAYGQGLKVGDRVPIGVLGEGVKGRLVLLDFWATWCAPCRAMMPRLDSLQREFKDKLLVLPVAYESERIARPVLAAMWKEREFRFEREVFGDTVLVRLFPHRTLPHYVWISGAGVVLATTEAGEVNAANIRKILAGASANGLEQKTDVTLAYNKQKPLFLDGNGGDGSGVRYQSVLSGYVAGLPAAVEVTPFDSLHGQRYGVHDAPFLWLCRLAYADKGRNYSNSRIRILSKDSALLNTKLAGQAYHRWLEAGNGWCYELLLPPNLADSGFRYVQEDLRRLFPAYDVSVDTQKVKSLVLVRTGSTDKIKSQQPAYKVDISPYYAHLRGAYLKDLMMRLERQYLQNSTLPLADGTDYPDRIDLDLEASLSDLAAVNKALAKYDLAFIEKDWPAELLVIRDRPLGTRK